MYVFLDLLFLFWSMTDAIKMARACVQMKDERLTESVHQWKPTGKRARGRTNKRLMDCTEEDPRQAGVTKCGKTAGRQRMTLNDIAADRQQWRNLTAASMAEISWTMTSLVPHLCRIQLAHL